MRNTSTGLSVRKPHLPEVEVLLATFNGALYLTEFLDSLTRQEGVKIHLRVSDDGSTDDTLKIVRSYEDNFESCLISKGPCDGPSSNFFSLIEKATFEFIALADQDDVWFPEHLFNSVNRLKSNGNPLTMTFCQVVETNEVSTNYKRIWPNISSSPELHEIFFENLARGCTIVFTKDLAKLISKKPRDRAIMHDWWIYLVAKTCGAAIFSLQPEVKYRIHEKNAIGHGPKFHQRVLNFVLNTIRRKWAPWEQLEQIQFHFQDFMLADANADFIWLFNIPNLQFKLKLHEIFFTGRRLRKGSLSNAFVKCYLLTR